MRSYFYGLCVLVSVFILTTAAVSKSNQQTRTPAHHQSLDLNNKRERQKLGMLILQELDSTFDNLVKLRPIRSTKLEDKHEVIKAIRRIIDHKTKKTGQNHEHDTHYINKLNQKAVDTIAASDLVQTVLSAKPRSKRFAKPSDNINKQKDDIPENSRIAKPELINKETDNLSTKSRSKRFPNIEKIHDKINDLSAKTRLKILAKPIEKINNKIDNMHHGRDLVLEAVKQLIEGEKTRRRFDMVNPPNSQYSKRQQLLWDRLRVKAAEELLLHPITFPERATERIFDSFKKDWEILQTTGPTIEPGLFNDFKRRIEKQYYLDEYGARRRDFISTLKPRVYLQ